MTRTWKMPYRWNRRRVVRPFRARAAARLKWRKIVRCRRLAGQTTRGTVPQYRRWTELGNLHGRARMNERIRIWQNQTRLNRRSAGLGVLIKNFAAGRTSLAARLKGSA